MIQKINNVSQSLIEYSFLFLFFLVPLVMTPFNYELFEYNKMILTYAFTVIIFASWLVKIVVNGKIKIVSTPLDIPILLFLASQIVSTFFSIDPHVSIWGYYSRSNGGLLSTFSYLILYYAFVANFPREKIGRLLKFILAGGTIVSIYGIMEHFGASPSCLLFTGRFNVDCWVQDVQNRVFATLGQPNWMAAYLTVLIPLTLGIGLSKFLNLNGYPNDNDKYQNQNRKLLNKNSFFVVILYYCLTISLFLALLFTKSRSGFIGFTASNVIFWLILLYKFRKTIFKSFLILNSFFLILIFIFGSPFDQINRFTLPELTKNNQQPKTNNQQIDNSSGTSLIEVGITESGKIRQIVWKGAIEIFRRYPLFGSGVETFAFSYYLFRPVEHNMTSEWDFLYNKAHNEYLNYAATTGIFGLGSYLLFIGMFIWWNIRNSINYDKNQKILTFYFLLLASCFSAWTSILVTNFFGFSVVIIQLFFFLIPAISFVLTENINSKTIYSFGTKSSNQLTIKLSLLQKILIIFFLLLASYFLIQLARLWYADTLFAHGYRLARSQNLTDAYSSIRRAIELNDREPFYYDELAYPAAQIAVALFEEKETTTAAQFADGAISASNLAVSISPNNVNYFKTRTRVFYALSAIDPKYEEEAYKSLLTAKELSPTDPKIMYNLAVFAENRGKTDEAIADLIQTTKLKPDYREAYIMLAYLYQKKGDKEKARESLEFILKKLNPNDEEAKKLIEELK